MAQKGDNLADDVVGALCSFSGEALVTTAEGLIAISALEMGDYVLAYDEATGTTGFYPILATWLHEDPIIVALVIDGEVVETTPEHPFFTEEGNWVAAGDLQAGDRIRQADGTTGTVEAVTFVHRPQPMYNLTVATAHTFFVGDGQWLVHNHCDEEEAIVAAIKQITDQYQKGDYRCLECVRELSERFEDEGTVYLILANTDRELFGPHGERIGAPRGWHVVWVREKTKMVYDNGGNQGPMAAYFNNMFIRNGPDLKIELTTVADIEGRLPN